MSHKLNSAVAEIGVEIGKDSFDVAGQDKRDEMHSEASSSSQPSIITRDQGRRGRPRVPSVTAIRKICSIPEGDDKSGVVQCKISAEPVSVVGHQRPRRSKPHHGARPLCLRKRTYATCLAMSASCHKPTKHRSKNVPLFDHLVGTNWQFNADGVGHERLPVQVKLRCVSALIVT